MLSELKSNWGITFHRIRKYILDYNIWGRVTIIHLS